jgi:tripartite-type tricarboxylate transporter receptor subunit TctC
MKCWLILTAVLAGTGVNAAERVTYPAQPIRMIIPQAPGSTTDLLGRIIFTRVSNRLGRQIVVDNRPGAGGTLGMEVASQARPDGYTLVGVAASMLAITPHIYRRITYDPQRDFAPVGMFVLAQTALCVHATLPVNTVRDLVDLAKAKPESLNMASAGVGATSHLGGLMFATLAGIHANHVPYKDAGLSMAAVGQGESHWTVAPLSTAIPHVKAGRQRCLATGGEIRSAVTPDLPTIAESGLPGFRFYGWNGVVAPRGTPRQIITRFNRVMNESLGSAAVRKLYFDLGAEPVRSSPEAFGDLIREDYQQMGRLVTRAGITAE